MNWKLSSIVMTLMTSFMLTGCHVPKDIGYEMKTVKLVNYKRPKHFKVSIQDVETGSVMSIIYVSKRCSRYHHRVQKGEIFEMPFIVSELHRKDGVTEITIRPDRSFLKKKYCL